jgi:hypothetical protein
MDTKLDAPLKLSQDGNCPSCDARIRIDGPGKTIFKGRLFIRYKSDQEMEIKCPICKTMLLTH